MGYRIFPAIDQKKKNQISVEYISKDKVTLAPPDALIEIPESAFFPLD